MRIRKGTAEGGEILKKTKHSTKMQKARNRWPGPAQGICDDGRSRKACIQRWEHS